MAACARRLPPRLERPHRGTVGGAPPHSCPGCGVAVGLGGGGDVLPKQRGEVTLVGVADPGADLVEGQRGLRSEEHTSELQSRSDLVCRLLLEKKKNKRYRNTISQDVSVQET